MNKEQLKKYILELMRSQKDGSFSINDDKQGWERVAKNYSEKLEALHSLLDDYFEESMFTAEKARDIWRTVNPSGIMPESLYVLDFAREIERIVKQKMKEKE